MGPYKASTLLDFEKGLPLELESLFLEPLHQAGAAQAVLPQMKALGKLLTQIDALRSHPK
jgi:2-dehydropantoate 2-reductase